MERRAKTSVTTAYDCLDALGTKLAEVIDQDRTKALQVFRRGLLENLAALTCGGAIQLKDVIAAIAKIDEMLSGATAAENPLEEIAAFLNKD